MQFSQTASASPGATTHRHRLIFAAARSNGLGLFAIFIQGLALEKTISYPDYLRPQAQLLSQVLAKMSKTSHHKYVNLPIKVML
jgi:hypothetical protein